MKRRSLLFYVLLFINSIHMVENTCDNQEIKSRVGNKICKNSQIYYNYDNNCHMEYPIIKKTVTCSHMSLSEILSNIYVPEDATFPVTLKVTYSDIAVLPTSVFKDTNKLSVLHLENSNIQKIVPGAFNFLDDLRELYLKGNRLATISHGLFNSVTSLQILDLSRNQIEDISDQAFEGVHLVELYLNNNNISELGAFLDPLTRLNALDMSWNYLNNITRINNIQLSRLDLSHNVINMVDFEFFPTNLIKIDLSFNRISEIINYNVSGTVELILNHNNIRNLNKTFNVEFLDVSYNEIETIDSDLFGDILKRFHAGNNLISFISTDAFFGLYNLEYLLLNSNNLTYIPNSCFKDLHSLIHLDLSRNKLTSFTFGTFDNLLSLEVLNISYNNLQNLHQDTFHSLGNLTDFAFQNNEISELNILDLKLHMTKLKSINLDGNAWSCKKLVDIVQRLKMWKISFLKGNYWQESNIHGIKCFDTSDRAAVDASSPLKTDTDLGYSKLDSFFNEDFTKTIMYKYFNKDFKDSNFFKYLESLNNNTGGSQQNINTSFLETLIKELKMNCSDLLNKGFAESDMFNYFNKDFKNSAFYKYLETLKNKASVVDASEKLIDSKLEQVLRSFKETLENKSLSQDIYKSDMYKYIKEDFKNFLKHLESLNNRSIPNNSEYFNASKVEKFVGKPREDNPMVFSNTGLLSFILMFLILNTFVLTIYTYLSVFRAKKFSSSKKEEVELI